MYFLEGGGKAGRGEGTPHADDPLALAAAGVLGQGVRGGQLGSLLGARTTGPPTRRASQGRRARRWRGKVDGQGCRPQRRARGRPPRQRATGNRGLAALGTLAGAGLGGFAGWKLSGRLLGREGNYSTEVLRRWPKEGAGLETGGFSALYEKGDTNPLAPPRPSPGHHGAIGVDDARTELVERPTGRGAAER